ncbi:aminoglycoside phosphotransferase family protein [Actinomadura sp. ATCC 31491]|uniref:Aminoglycoside phosphotransferase family protein n=1 Tax=Actinomadura luzonensis TaxID=2805427 RepID=A0ABT0FJG1_9ACTN|nr:aminoglycoside phosphotransferase family protein [Actinomadura luzonensis]MCK2212441.1 aminoglycoside phosphotransferase family protein [Actinomadura luzonensis]
MVATVLHEIPLQGGDVTDGVVRVGDTVRRPVSASTPAVHALLRHLEAVGFAGAPRVVGSGVDGLGRQVLEYLPGSTGVRLESVRDDVLGRLGGLLREYHDATRGFPLRREGWEGGSNDDRAPEVVGHCDLTPGNVVFRAGVPYGMIDFDLARPTTRLFDVVTTLRHWAPLADPVDRHPLLRNVAVGRRVRVFCDAYGVPARERRRLVEVARVRFQRSYAVMRSRAAAGGNWAQMWAGGAGERIRRAVAWLDVHEDEIHAHLVP